MQDIIRSYGVHQLLEAHLPGTRQWLFDRANKWLAATYASDDGANAGNRMFILLADPGMVRAPAFNGRQLDCLYYAIN